MRLATGCVVLFLGTALAQNPGPPPPTAAWRLNFQIQEMEDGRRVSMRNYSLLVGNDNSGRVRLGQRVPITTGANQQVQYYDVGLSLDCRLHEVDSQVRLGATVEISSLDSERAGNPVVRQVRSESSGVIVPGKPINIASMDDLTSKRHYEIEVTATRAQ